MRDFKVYQASGYLTKLVTDASDVRKEYEDISGSLVQFDTPISAPLASLIAEINPVQSGTGDPSPDNIRPITGWTGCEVWVKDEYDTTLPATASVTFPDTVYGGKYEFVSGGLKSKMGKIVLDGTQTELSGINWRSNSDSVGFYYNFSGLNIANPSAISIVTEAIADSVKAVPYDVIYSNHICSFAIFNVSGIERIYVRITDTTLTTKELINAYLAQNPITICYPLATPTEIQLTPQEINTLIGVNNIWADTGDVSVKYRTH